MPRARNWLPVLIALFAVAPYAATADTAPAPTPVAATVDEEEQVDDGLKRFGYLAGLARGCVVENGDCADVLAAYESRVEKFRASRGGTQ